MEEITIKLTLHELNTILTGLGSMPYLQVHELIAKLHQQGKAQLEQAESRAS